MVLDFKQRTEIIREMIVQRMSYAPHPDDLSISELKVWPDLLIWGCPEGMIFNIINSARLYLNQGFSVQEAIREIEECEEGNVNDTRLFSSLNEYILYRLQKEYSPFAYLYDDVLLTRFENFVSGKFNSEEIKAQSRQVKPRVIPNENNAIQKAIESRNIIESSPVKRPEFLNCNLDYKAIDKMIIAMGLFVIISLLIMGIVSSSDKSSNGGDEIKYDYEKLLNNAIKGGISGLSGFIESYDTIRYTRGNKTSLVFKLSADGKKITKSSPCLLQVEYAKLRLSDFCDDSYIEALEKNTFQGWQQYRENVPGIECRDALKRMQQLVQVDWERVLAVNTSVACEDFIEKYSQAGYEDYIDRARRKMLELDWRRVVAVNTSAVYEDFVERYSKSGFGEYVERARHKMQELHIVDMMKSGKCHELPYLSRVNSFDESESQIVIVNNLGQDIEVIYSGATYGSFNLSSGRQCLFSFSNGNYKIAIKTVVRRYRISTFPLNTATAPVIDDVLNQKMFAGEVYLRGGLYKMTVELPRKKVDLNSHFNRSQPFWNNSSLHDPARIIRGY